ncbi:hypothetical protein CHS0354_022676 [Potamilus streckersoni]|uniref:Uncharacterized protein n=1 Tax=Potamilus streckersoni TaxID=2493646 RepID=A0AAE0VQK0_9BIVA|nr:hypothetical protein CHS0354_022676 [Potamilus streckersoni]
MFSEVKFGSLLFVLGHVCLTPSAVIWDENRDCPFSNPSCHCVNQFDIDCSGRNWPAVPKAHPVQWSYRVINLRDNKFTTIHSNDFLNVNVSAILLDENSISSIRDGAFNGLKNNLRLLDLENNNLTYLPKELETLNNLEYLDLRGNSIPSSEFNDTIMRKIGDYLTTFYFGHEQLDQWPTTIRHFQQLRQLELRGGSMLELPISAFQGFEWTLLELSIKNTKLISVPIALQNMHSVHTFYFDDNTNVGDAGILAPAFAGMVKTLRTLTLENDGLTDFPDILLTLQEIQNLSLARNKLEFVSDASVQKIASIKLTILNLKECGLDRVPGALSQLTSLQDLDLSNNRIFTIEGNDFQNLGHLINLTLNNNSVSYISDSSFRNLSALQKLEMKNTSLKVVPEAVRNIKTLDVLDLRSPQPMIECICGTMTWLYHYFVQRHNFTIYGECETIEGGIENYARQRVPAYCV